MRSPLHTVLPPTKADRPATRRAKALGLDTRLTISRGQSQVNQRGNRSQAAVSSKNSKANRIETMKGPAESGEICSVEVEENFVRLGVEEK